MSAIVKAADLKNGDRVIVQFRSRHIPYGEPRTGIVTGYSNVGGVVEFECIWTDASCTYYMNPDQEVTKISE